MLDNPNAEDLSMANHNASNARGFSFVEMLVVVMFAAILAAMFWPSGVTIPTGGGMVLLGVFWITFNRPLARWTRDYYLGPSRWLPTSVPQDWVVRILLLASGIVAIVIGCLIAAGILVEKAG